MLVDIECEEVKWAKCKTPEQPMTPDQDPKWSIVCYPTKEAIEIVRDLQSEGIKNVVKKDQETNKYFVKFSRPTVTRNRKTKEITKKWDAPVIKEVDGTILDGDSVGNGSKGVIHLDVYEHGTPNGGKAKAARLNSITITQLIPYTRN